MSRQSGTISWDGHPYRSEGLGSGAPVPTLCIAWSFDEPERIGETALVAGPLELGRGDEGSGPARALWYQQRDREWVRRPPLSSRRISRSQLLLEPRSDGVFVRQIGRTPLVVDGIEVAEAFVPIGGCFSLSGALLLWVDSRAPAPASSSPVDFTTMSFPFGAADRDGMVGESQACWTLRARLAELTESTRPLLILGESGTGKELAARAVHRGSPRSRGPFVARNAATIPEGLADAELFGSIRGYPHASAPERPGLLGEAEGGTVFLDELGELPLAVQAHLLRLLDEGAEYQKLGEARTRRADVRIVAATNRSVDELKHDLAARFSLRVELSPLGARRSDIPLLIQHQLRRLELAFPALERFAFAGLDGLRRYRVTPELVESAMIRPYRTHSRELEALLLDAAAHSPHDYLDLPHSVSAKSLRYLLDEDDGASGERARPSSLVTPADSSGELLRDARRYDEVSRDELERALASSEGNVTHAATNLGLKNRYVLLRLMKKFGLGRG
ncbi:MAG TPA: sigma 54-interacting transcriptional regulator [Polyangiaceae bacterium]|nr:sigma 54-interacting transcriptional regulator [Polyangiaceae bacterium]